MKSNTNEESIEDFSKLTYRQRFAVTEYGYLLSPENAEVVGKMLGNFQEKDVLPFCQANGKKVPRSQELIPNILSPEKAALRDTAIGFFGWIMFNNFYFIFLLALSSFGVGLSKLGGYGLLVYFGLPVVIMPLIFFAKKRIWIGIGIVVAVIINAAMWTIFCLSVSNHHLSYYYFLFLLVSLY